MHSTVVSGESKGDVLISPFVALAIELLHEFGEELKAKEFVRCINDSAGNLD